MRLGSLCTGYGGLDMAVQNVLGTELAWTSDIDPGACKILAHRFPNVPNIGDLTIADWSALEPIDVLTAGYPCQPFSHAGRRKGTDDVRHIWPYIRDAIRRIRPRVTVMENVSGHRSLGFDSVLGDLAEDGLHVRWTSLRAADVGACHRRERLFIVVTQDADEPVGGQWWQPASRQAEGGRPRADAGGSGGVDDTDAALLPTPAVNDMGAGKTPVAVAMLRPHVSSVQASHSAAQRLLPTPTSRDWKDGGYVEAVPENALLGRVVWQSEADFGQYAAAVDRWATIIGRPAPAPTEPTGRGDAHRLSPRFVEWMMGLPDGWVTDVSNLTRNQQLKALGNGVVPQQAEAALRMLLGAGGVATPTDHHASLLPTPRGQDSDESPETFDARTDALQEGGRNGGKTGTPLGVEVQRLTAP